MDEDSVYPDAVCISMLKIKGVGVNLPQFNGYSILGSPPELGVLHSHTIGEDVIVDKDGLRITAFEVSQPPIEPAYDYRLGYGGRSVVISGDSVVTDKMVEISDGADAVLHDAMALQPIQGAETMSRGVGNTRIATVLPDIQGYHATTADLARLAAEADI